MLKKAGVSLSMRSMSFLGVWLRSLTMSFFKFQRPPLMVGPVLNWLKSLNSSCQAVKPPPNINFAQQPMASVVKGINPPARPPAILPPIRYAAAAAAAITPQATSQPPPSATTASTPTIPSAAAPSSSTSQPPGTPSLPPATPQISNAIPSVQDQISRVPPSPSLTHQSTISPLLSSSASQQPDGSFYSGLESPALSEAIQQSIASPQQPVITHKGESSRVIGQFYLHLLSSRF